MLLAADEDSANGLLENLDLRRATFQKMLKGELNPIDRRLKIFERRQSLLFGSEGDFLAGDSSNGGKMETQKDRDTSDPQPAERVDLEATSPKEDEILAANAVAEKYPDAETVTLSDDGSIEVQQASGGSFTQTVEEVKRRELGAEDQPETKQSTTPSMITAVANKRGGG